MEKVKIGMLGSGFVANFYMEGLQNVPNQEVILNTSQELESAREFAEEWNIPEPMDSIEEAISRKDVDLFVIALPNFLHEEVVLKLAEAEHNMVCTKPLARNVEEARSMLRAVEEKDLIHGYAETEVFSPAVVKVRNLIEQGALGDITWVRSRESHPGPHQDWFWDKELAGGGALIDMGCHCIEAGRYFFGKDCSVEEIMAWGDTLVHTEKTDAEDSALLIMRFENGGISQIEVSWTTKGGLDLRNEIYGTEGSAFTDVTRSTPITAFAGEEAGYTVEKAETDTGWIHPLPEEAFTYGYQAEMKHFVNCVREEKEPRETFEDGYIVNQILEAAYESMEKKEWLEVNY